jgi:outer membrane lipoprotein SlyB
MSRKYRWRIQPCQCYLALWSENRYMLQGGGLMRQFRYAGVTAIALGILTAFGSGCANQTQTGALVGTGAGAGIGAIIGHQIGKEKEGALIGAAVGAASGALIGKKQDDKDEQDAVNRNVAYRENQRHAQERAMSNFDVIEMVQSTQVSDAIVISSIQDRGGAFDTSPQAIISLKKAGVSDTVVMAMQRHNLAK